MRFVQQKKLCYPLKCSWNIWERNKEIGRITYKIVGRYVVVSKLYIFKEYQKQGFGYQVVEYLLKRYPTKSIVGESIHGSTGFWRKCISKYNGKRKNIHYCNNCTSSFIIPRRDISHDDLKELLEIAFEIN